MSRNSTLSRNLCIIFCLLLGPANMQAQSGKMENLPNLVLPQFTEGTVILKTGDSYNAVMNYEMLEQQMIVQKNGKYFILMDQDLVDTIIISERAFIPYGKIFYEVLASGPVSLFYEPKCILESIGGVVPYDTRGTSGGLAGNTTNYGPGGAIELKIPENYKIVDASETWVRKDGVMQRISNKKQFMKLLADKETEVTRFIKQNNTDFRNLDDLTKLAEYYNGLN